MTSVDMTGDGREEVWREVIALTHLLEEWVLVGGLMVSLWARHHGVAMPRVTDDIDALFRAESYLGQPRRSVVALQERGYSLDDDQPVDGGRGEGLAFRFHRGEVSLDVLVPDKFATADRPVHTLPPYVASMVPGGSYALRHQEQVEVTCTGRSGSVPVTTPIGGLLMKRRAQQTDTSAARARHGDDLAVLWACVADPLTVEVSKKERKVLRSAAANAHWGVLDPDAAEAGRAAADLVIGP